MRPDKITYYFDIARIIGERSSCTRRKLGAILVKNDSIISTGYNGAIRGGLNCGIEIKCLKDIHNIPSYQGHDLCAAIHAEENAIINAARTGISVIGATLYLTPTSGKCQRPCSRCRKMIIQAGIKDCWYIDLDGSQKHEEISTWVELENKWMKEMETNIKDLNQLERSKYNCKICGLPPDLCVCNKRVTELMPPITCPHCGSTNTRGQLDGSRICSNCGKSYGQSSVGEI